MRTLSSPGKQAGTELRISRCENIVPARCNMSTTSATNRVIGQTSNGKRYF
ncbi:hypothetical protein FXW07_11970 [Methanosarcina sp. DH1]|uniref:hypothetical protein n=1 Tax=Methanosarcina sp. DH1 TaxID=2605695 RepID=UPI001E4DA733|nr:hypothetical protein [Methanosarcina sp. DH1]MCC4767317.1 hypothetical protein [Methanosarcina sp. DH1]